MIPALLAPLRLTTEGPASPWWDRAAKLLLVVLMGLVVWTFQDYGITWDERPHMHYGDMIGNWYATFGHNDQVLTYRANYYYSGGYDALGAIFRLIARPLHGFAAMHLLGGLIGVLGVWGTWALGRTLGGPRVGFLAALLLVIHPVYYGHMFNNPKDLPFAVAHVWALWAMVHVIAEFPRPSRTRSIQLAVAIGAALSTRIGGLLLLCYLALACLVFAGVYGRAHRSVAVTGEVLWRLARWGLGVTAAAWLIMLVTWPWALLDPLRRPFIALTHMSMYSLHKRIMPFRGEDIWNYDIGWDYLPTYFAYQLPELLLVFGSLGTGLGIAWIVRAGLQPNTLRPVLALGVLGMSLWFPPLYAIYKQSILYDAYRHFLFVLPPLVVLAALAVEHVGLRLGLLFGRTGRDAMVIVVGAACLDMTVTMVRLHPHQYIYFNRLIGGLAGAHGKFDTDYYGNTFKEAFAGLRDHLWQHERASYLDTVYYYHGCLSTITASYYIDHNFLGHRRRPEGPVPDFHVGYTRNHCDQRYPRAPVIFQVVRDGASLNVVRDLRRPGARVAGHVEEEDTP